VGIVASLTALACTAGPAATPERATPAPAAAAPATPAPAAAAPASDRGAAPLPAAAAATDHAAAPPPLIPARSAFTTLAVSAAPWWVAQDGEYFRQQGLDVDLKFVEGGAVLLAALQSGEIEVTASGGAALVLGYLQGLETIVIGSTSNKLDSTLFVQPEVQQVDDLRGRVVAVNAVRSISDVAARLALKQVGLQPDVDVTIRATGGQPQMLAALATRNADGAMLNRPLLYQARKLGYRELLDTSAMALPFLSQAIGSTRKTLRERPELGEPYLRALAQAMSRMRTDREFTMQVVARYTDMDDRELLEGTVDFISSVLTMDPYPEPAALQTVIDQDEHPGARTLRPEDMTDYRFADQLRRSGYLEQLPR
jgi:ABC-type nitrate/sulfonate/bicarbonate transport system substrate-binding protein